MYRKTALPDGGRGSGRAFPRLQVGLEAGQEVCPIPACLFICRINLGEPLMREDHLCPVVDRRELPGDAGSCPLRRALPGNPVHFRSFVQFGHLKLKDTCGRPKAKFSKRAHLWFDSRLVGPPANDFVLLSYGAPDALRGGKGGRGMRREGQATSARGRRSGVPSRSWVSTTSVTAPWLRKSSVMTASRSCVASPDQVKTSFSGGTTCK